jgi:hypothetical protein
MKTPREILLTRHQALEPKLDAIRHAVVGKLNNEAARQQSLRNSFVSWFPGCSKNLWRELIWPCRRTWAGLAAVWILIFAVNFSLRDRSGPTFAKTPPSPQMILAIRQQEQLLNELIGPNEAPVTEPQKTYLPRPDSLRTFEILTT